MSLASDFAAKQAAARVALETVAAQAPTSMMDDSGASFVVDEVGSLRIVPPSPGTFTLNPRQALALAQWITSTFA